MIEEFELHNWSKIGRIFSNLPYFKIK
jgi:hypothetical protein